MFIGHFGLALAAKKASPTVSLAMLFVACEFADLLWPVLVLAGVEVVAVQPGATAMTPLNFISYPYSHSLVMLCVWGIALAAVYVALTHAGIVAALAIALLVVSHWVLDVVTHRPDMPITPTGATRVGLGLWNSVPATIAVESAMFAAGLAMYLRAATWRTRSQTVGLWALVALMLIIYVGNTLGPPPPSVAAVAWSAEGIWLLVAWAYFIDRSRRRDGKR
jgi:hypothetical protein